MSSKEHLNSDPLISTSCLLHLLLKGVSSLFWFITGVVHQNLDLSWLKRCCLSQKNIAASPFATSMEGLRGTTKNRKSARYEEEADTRILLHFISIQSPKNVVFRTSDTDVLIILLANMHRFDRNTNIWIEAGISSKITLGFVDVSSIYRSLGDLLSRALTGFHALTAILIIQQHSNKREN